MTASGCTVGGVPTCDVCGCASSATASASGEGAKQVVPRGAAGAGALAVACGVCCVLPIAVPALALSSLGGTVAIVSRGYRWAMWFALGAIVIAWTWAGIQRVRTGRRIHPVTRRGMLAATLIVAAAYAWLTVERVIVAVIRG